MSTLKRLVHEVHRRSLWQVLGIYVAGSWVALQVVEFLTENMGLPAWVMPFAIALLVIGLPVVLATAFVQEGIGGGTPAAVAPPGSGAAASAPDSAAAASAPDSGAAASAGESPAAAVTRSERPGPAGGPIGGPPAPEGVTAFGPGGVGASRPEGGKPGARHRIFTWRNAVLGGVGGFALLGLVTAGYVAMRTLGIGPAGTLVAKGVLDERARILIAEFESRSGGEELARAATETFRIDFAQSRIVSVVQPTAVAAVLARMGRDRESRLVEELAREVAIREGIPAIVTGEVNSVGGGYVLSAQLVAVGTGEVLVPVRETAKDSSRIIDAIDRLSAHMRERIGESLRRLGAEPPLERVTTGSLSALQKYSQALHAIDIEGDEERGIALLEEAVREDSAFAMAHRKIAVVLGNRDENRAREIEALSAALRHRDRLTERERYHTEGLYHVNVTGDLERARNAFRNLVELDPSDSYGLHNLGVVYALLRDSERAVEQYRRAIEADSTAYLSYVASVHQLYQLGRPDEARAMLETLLERFPDHPGTEDLAAQFAVADGDYVEAEARLLSLRRRTSGSGFWRWQTSWDLWALDVTRGRLAEARAHMRDAMEAQEERGLPGQYLANAVDMAAAELIATGRPEPALEQVEEALSRHSLEELHPLNRPYTGLAAFYAQAGRPQRARELLESYRAEVPAELRDWLEQMMLGVAEGELALAEGRPGDALAAFRRADVSFCTICLLWELARAHEALGRPDSAIVYYRRYMEEPSLNPLHLDDRWQEADALERLGRLYDEAGDLENAARYYARFVELWREADPELQPRVEAAQARLEAIVAERG